MRLLASGMEAHGRPVFHGLVHLFATRSDSRNLERDHMAPVAEHRAELEIGRSLEFFASAGRAAIGDFGNEETKLASLLPTIARARLVERIRGGYSMV